MNAKVKVSVLMLTYNHKNYIADAIESVIKQQTDFPFELVIGEDRSTDSTANICREYQKKYPEIIKLTINDKNLGLQENFIRSYNRCSGEYIAICEGDDFWTNKHKLQIQADFLDSHKEYSACFHRVINYYQYNGTKSLSNGGQKEDTTIIDLAKSNYISNVSAMFRRGLFGELPDWFTKVSTYDYAIHLLNAQYGKIHYMKTPMAVYRQHKSAIWSKAGTDKKLSIALQVRELLMDYFHDNKEVLDALRGAHKAIATNLINYYHSINQEDEISSVEERIIKYNPNLSIDLIRQQTAHQSVSFKMKLKSYAFFCLKQARALVSRFIPLPRI